MIILLSTRLYYCACTYLWYIFSAEMSMEEGESADEYLARVGQWYDLHMKIMYWLVNERDFVLNKLYLSEDSRTDLSNRCDNHLYKLNHHWSNRWTTTAQQLATEVPAISAGTWQYYLYAAWHRHCLQAFDTLLHTSALQDTPWRRRYHEQFPLFQQMRALRQAEQPSVATAPSVYSTIDHWATDLAQEWREAVEWAAAHLPWDQLTVGPPTPPAPPHPDDDIPY